MPDSSKDTYKPETQSRDSGKSVLIITGDGVEDIEFFYPYYRFIEAGFKVDVATPGGGPFKGKHGLELKESKKVKEVKPDDYQMLYLPGGTAPTKLRNDLDVLDVVRSFAAAKKLISALCHGPQILAAAHVIDGCKIAAWPEIENEVVEGGATYMNSETVVDGRFVTGRWPGDLPMHLKRTLEEFGKANQRGERKNTAA